MDGVEGDPIVVHFEMSWASRGALIIGPCPRHAFPGEGVEEERVSLEGVVLGNVLIVEEEVGRVIGREDTVSVSVSVTVSVTLTVSLW